jgi:CheY-like chemotaxis protein
VAKILIVDDDSDIVTMLVQVLQDEHYEVRSASGEAGLALAQAEQPSAILLDIMMPGMDGVEVCRRLRANPQTAHIPVIAMSASARLSERATEMDVDGLLAKPFDLNELLANVERLVRLPAAEKSQSDDGSAVQP